MFISPAWILSLKTAPGKWKIRCLENLAGVLKSERQTVRNTERF